MITFISDYSHMDMSVENLVTGGQLADLIPLPLQLSYNHIVSPPPIGEQVL